MKYWTIIFFVLITNVIYSQTIWAPEGAVWYYDYQSVNSVGYTKIEYVGDTTINTKQCKILEKIKYVYSYNVEQYDTIALGKEYTYSENNKVYYFRFGEFYTLYDFNSINNDTWLIAGTEPTFEYEGLCDSTASVLVDSNDIINYNTYNLNRLYVSYNDTNKWLIYGKIIERIGASSYMFPINNCIIDANVEGGQLRCYYDNEFGSYNVSAQECDYVLSSDINSIKIINNRIFPSLITSSINNVNIISNKLINTLRVINIEGRLVFVKIINKNEYVLNISDLQNGIYIVNFNDTNNKLIINK